MNARWWWLGYALAVAMVVGAMGWFTSTVRAGQGAERRAERAAFADDTARLALWRLDSRLASVLAREAGRPYLAYNAFYPATGALDKTYDNFKQGDVIVPSPLLGLDQEEVLLHVQYASDGAVTSPQVPMGNLRLAAVPGICSAQQLAVYSRRLMDFSTRITRQDLDRELLANPAASSETTIARMAYACPVLVPGSAQEVPQGQGIQQEQSRSGKEQAVRNSSIQALTSKTQQDANRQVEPQHGDYAALFNDAAKINGVPTSNLPGPQRLDAEIMRPLWLHGQASPGQAAPATLVLARRVRVGATDWLQACWLDWPLIRRQLLDSIRDLLPEADVVPASGAAIQPHRLATLPLILIPGSALPDWQEPPMIGATLPMIGAWSGVLIALIAGGVLLGGALALSERRGAFVSAVTHELRTPLTTFRLYTDLLADGRVTDPAERQRCLDTLRVEADRLGHLVENVLGYARLERTPLPTTALGIATLIDGMRGRLGERAGRAGLELVTQVAPDTGALAIRGEAQAIERILVNLVDNACKYATAARDRRLHLEITRRGHEVAFTIRDHGPGIPADLLGRLFTPFAKSAAEAAITAPGIGLGLALSRRLARQLGGDLRCQPPGDGGAAFVFTLPLA